jgi:hypothetical protein
MNDLISKSAIVDRLSEEAKRLAEIAIHSKGQAVDYYTGAKTGMAKAAIIVSTEQIIDAVPVVRCKDCKYGGELCDSIICFYHNEDGNYCEDDGFCAWGERKTDGTD